MKRLLVLFAVLSTLGCTQGLPGGDASVATDAGGDVTVDAGGPDATALDSSLAYTPAPHVLGMDYPTVGGDLSGTTNAAKVVGIQGKALPALAAGVLQYDGGSWSIGASVPPASLSPGTAGQVMMSNGTPAATWTTVTGDTTFSSSGVTTTGAVHGATVPAAGALTTGNGLYVTGLSSLGYSALDLAGGANYVTGALPTANQAAQTLGGDLNGSTATGYVGAISGYSGGGGTVDLGATVVLTALAGAGGISLGSWTGATTLPTGSLSWTGASTSSGALSAGSGGISLDSTGSVKLESAYQWTPFVGTASTQIDVVAEHLFHQNNIADHIAHPYHSFTLTAHHGLSFDSTIVGRVKVVGTYMTRVDETVAASCRFTCYWTGTGDATCHTPQGYLQDLCNTASSPTACFVCSTSTSAGTVTVLWAKYSEVTTDSTMDLTSDAKVIEN